MHFLLRWNHLTAQDKHQVLLGQGIIKRLNAGSLKEWELLAGTYKRLSGRVIFVDSGRTH